MFKIDFNYWRRRGRIEWVVRRIPFLFKMLQRKECNAQILPECAQLFYEPIFFGCWVGLFSSPIPRNACFIGEKCYYEYIKPQRIWHEWRTKAVSIQIKYFLQCIADVDEQEHTIIYEANVNGKRLWWTYGQPLYKGELTQDRWANIVNFRKKGELVMWLKLHGTCYNKHCKKIWAYDACGTQHFVKEHQLCPRK